MNMVFLRFTSHYIWYKTLPNTRMVQPNEQLVSVGVPMVKITNNANLGGIWRPYSKISTGGIQHSKLFITKHLIQTVMLAQLEITYIVKTEKRVIPNRF